MKYRNRIAKAKSVLFGCLILAIAGIVAMELAMQTSFAGTESRANEDDTRRALENPTIVADSNMTSGQKTTWDTIYYGYYPQTEIVGDSAQCGTIKNKIWASSTDYSVEPAVYARLQNAQYTKTGDTVIDGVKYRRLAKSDCTYIAPAQEITKHYFWNKDYSYHYFRYEPIRWRVLQVSGENALLLADKVLDDQPYNSEQQDVTWEKSTLRTWLNGADSSQTGTSTATFLTTAFRQAEIRPIVTTEVPNDDNYNYSTSGGATTHDRIFLLSENELYGTQSAKSYGFLSAYDHSLSQARDTEDEARRSKSTTYAKALGVGCNSETGFEGNSMWWMRTPGQFQRNAAFVCNKGFIRYYGSVVNTRDVGVRPSLVLNLNQAEWTYAGTTASDGTQTDESAPAMDIFTKEELGLTDEPSQPSATKVTKITVTAAPSVNIAAGKKFTVKAAVAPASAADKSVTWSSSNTRYATVSSKGVVTTSKKGAGKTVTITATAKDGSKVKGSVKVRIRKHRVKSIRLKAPKSIKRGKSGKVRVTVKTTGKDAYKKLRFTSSNKNVKVSGSGKVTVPRKAKKGTVRITATAQDGTGIRKTVKIKMR